MATSIVNNIPVEVCRALQMRAAAHGHSTEMEIRNLLQNGVKAEQRLRMGDAMAAIGHRFDLKDQDLAVFEGDKTPAEPMGFE